MSALTATTATTDVPDSLFRLTVDQYHEMMDAGILTTDDRVELLEGLLVRQMPKYPAHTGAVYDLNQLIPPLLPAGWRYRAEQPIILSDGEPEPDGVVARGTPADNRRFHPRGPDVALVIEVSDATLGRDRGMKLRAYARAGIPVYWIINLVDLEVEVYTDPDPTALPAPAYRTRAVYAGNAVVPIVAIGSDVIGPFVAATLLPPDDEAEITPAR